MVAAHDQEQLRAVQQRRQQQQQQQQQLIRLQAQPLVARYCCLYISCVQLGAGPQHAMPGWLNVDGAMPQDNQKPADGKQLYVSFSGFKVPFTQQAVCIIEMWCCQVSIPLPSASCEFIYASHVLEHLSMEPRTLDALMVELRRLLVPGGVGMPCTRVIASYLMHYGLYLMIE